MSEQCRQTDACLCNDCMDRKFGKLICAVCSNMYDLVTYVKRSRLATCKYGHDLDGGNNTLDVTPYTN